MLSDFEFRTSPVYITRDMIKTFRAATSEYFDLAIIFQFAELFIYNLNTRI